MTDATRPTKTLAIVKPDATERSLTGAILDMGERAGLRLLALRMCSPGASLFEAIYAEHAAQPWFPLQIEYMSSGPVMLAAFEGADAVPTWRSVMGATDRAKAAEGTVRRRFAQDLRRNSVHGSDSDASAAREIALAFPDLAADVPA